MNGPRIFFDHGTFESERQIAEQKRRQLLRENSPELRELESKLRQAYINKEIFAQISERKKFENLREEQLKEEAKYNEWLRRQAILEEEEEERKKALRRLELHRQLDCQIRDKRASFYEQKIDLDEERFAVDAIINQVKDEEQRKKDDILNKKALQRQTIEAFKESKRLWEEREKERIKQEEARIEKFLEMKDAWRQSQIAAVNERRQLKSQVVFQLGEARAVERERQEERENLRLEFHEGRLREMEKEVEQAEVTQEIRRRLQLREANQKAAEYRRLQREREERERRHWQVSMQTEAEKAMEIERQEIVKRKQQQVDLWKDAKILMEDARQRKEMEMLEERQFWAEIEEEERERKKVIESERRRMLREHAQRLQCFMPYERLTDEDKEILAQEDLTKLYFKKPDFV